MMRCTPRFVPHLKSQLAQIAELGVIEFGKRAVALVTAQQLRDGLKQGFVACKTDIAELALPEIGKGP
jgi:hypothetical protein